MRIFEHMSIIAAIGTSKLLFLNIGTAFFVTIACIFLLKPIASKVRLQDVPGGRKQHKKPTPVIGGVCMFIGFCFALLTVEHSLQDYRGFIGASALLILLGVIDDMHELSTKARFVTQIAAALVMVFGSDTIIHSFGNLIFFGDINLGYFAIPVTVFATVASINAVNMLDGVDGLLGSTALIQFAFLAYLAWLSGFIFSYIIIALIIAVLVAYLIFNFPLKQRNAKIFMGDAGSMFIGFCLTWFFINLTQQSHAIAMPVTMLWIFAIPLYDTTWLLIKRTLQHANPFIPGRDHLHHLLKATGISDITITISISVLTLLFAMIGIISLSLKINQSMQFVAFILLFAIYCLVINISWQWFNKQIIPVDISLGHDRIP